jgi:hypothetical protein
VSSTSNFFGNLVGGLSYKFEIVVRAQSNYNEGRVGLNLLASGEGNSVNYLYTTSSVTELKDGDPWKGYQYNIIGTITAGVGGSSLAVSLIDGTAATGSYPITATGLAVITLVGSVT